MWESMEKVLAEHKALSTKITKILDTAALLDGVKELIASIQAHIDDCFLILKCCWPLPKEALTEKFADGSVRNFSHF